MASIVFASEDRQLPNGHHHRRGIILLWNRRIRAAFQQQFDHRNIHVLCSAYQRRRSFSHGRIAGIVMSPDDGPFQSHVGIRIVIEELAHEIRRIQLIGDFRTGTAQHRPERVHIDGGIERRHSRAVGNVGIRTLFQQCFGQVEMRIDDGKNQRRAAIRIGQILIGSGIRQCSAESIDPCRAAYINWSNRRAEVP